MFKVKSKPINFSILSCVHFVGKTHIPNRHGQRQELHFTHPELSTHTKTPGAEERAAAFDSRWSCQPEITVRFLTNEPSREYAVEPSRAEPSQPNTTQPHPSQAKPSQAMPSNAESNLNRSQPDQTRLKPSQSQSRANPTQPKPGRCTSCNQSNLATTKNHTMLTTPLQSHLAR